MATMRRFRLTFLRSLISLTNQPHYYPTRCSQTFHRTLSGYFQTHPISPRFPNFQSPSPKSMYDPIDFLDLQPKNDRNNDMGSLQLVESLQKTKDFASKKEAIDFVTGSGVEIDVHQVYFAVWFLRNDWELALLAFELSHKWGFGDDKILGLIVWVLGTHRKFDIAWSLIRDFHTDVDTRRAMLAIIERYAASNFHEKAIKTFNFMEKLSASPDQSTLYSLLSALCKYGNVEEAEEFMLKNKKLFPLETEGFNIILHAWCTISVDILEAKRVWREMASNCITPDAMSFTYLISCFSKAGNLHDTLRLYDEMKKREWVPGLKVYNSLMYAMTRENCFGEALKLIKKIKELGLQPDSESYDCLICPLCEGGKHEEARALFSTMSQDGIGPTLETYKAFLTGGDLDSTLDILRRMKTDKVGPDSSSFMLIFDRFFKLKQPENVLKVWVEMRDFGVDPKSTHYYSLICGLVNCGCLMKAKEMHTEMVSNGFVDDPKIKKLLQGLEKGGQRGSVGPTRVSQVSRSESPFVSHNRPHRGRQKRGSKSLQKKQTFG